MNKLFSYLLRAFALAGATTLYLHFKQQKDMRDSARAVSTKIEKAGGQAIVTDSQVTILMDGKV